MTPRLIGIAGPSGSGKSELSRRLSAMTQAPILSIDSYYASLSGIPFERRLLVNFDDPASLDSALLFQHVRQLAAGELVQVPRYDFATHTRTSGADPLSPGATVLIEGLFTLYWNDLRDMLHTRVYVDLEDSVCYARRRERDVRERGRTAESVEQVYFSTVRPMAEKYIWPTKRHANVVVRGDAVLDEAANQVLRAAGL
ncbi:MAG: uridine kinase [Acidobacteria bacterium]|nr:uridine kinase [Acidobacteriota bacterium]